MAKVQMVPTCLEVTMHKIDGDNCPTVKTDYLERITDGEETPHLYDLQDPQPDNDQDFMICTIESMGGDPPTNWKMVLRHVEGSPAADCWGHFAYLYQETPDDEPMGSYSRSGYDDLVVVDECSETRRRSRPVKTPPETLTVSIDRISQSIRIVPPGFDPKVPWVYSRDAGCRATRSCYLTAEYSFDRVLIGWALEIVDFQGKLTRFAQPHQSPDPVGTYVSITSGRGAVTAKVH